MANLKSETPVVSMNDIVSTLRQFVDNGGYDDEELFYFVSELTGVSEDALAEEIFWNKSKEE